MSSYAARVSSLSNDALELAADEFLEDFGDIRPATIQRYLDVISGEGTPFHHHIVNAFAVEVALRDGLRRKDTEEGRRLLERCLRWQVLMSEILYRWSLSDLTLQAPGESVKGTAGIPLQSGAAPAGVQSKK